MTEIERINSWLRQSYRTLENVPLYRLVWSDKVFEHRFGTYNDFTESGLFIRQVSEVRLVRKYSYIHERYIFEMWADGSKTSNRETPDALNGDYIPVYVFEDKQGKYLPPTEKVVRFLISCLQGNVRKDEIPSQEYLDQKEISDQVISMDTHPYFQTRPGEARNAVGYTKELKDVN